MSIIDTAKMFFDELEGGPRFWWAKHDPSFLVDRNNEWIIWDRVGWRIDRETQLPLLLSHQPPALPALEVDGDTSYWEAEGFTRETISHFGLGHFRNEMGDCWIIPVKDAAGNVIQHRYRVGGQPKTPGKDQYRYYTLPPALRVELFRAEREIEFVPSSKGNYEGGGTGGLGEVLFVSGEKKAMRLWQEGFTAYSSTGGPAFPWRWLPFFRKLDRIYVLFDSFEFWVALRIARLIGENAYVASLPEDVDEWFKHGGRPGLFREWLGRAMPVTIPSTRIQGRLALKPIPDGIWYPESGEDGQ